MRLPITAAFALLLATAPSLLVAATPPEQTDDGLQRTPSKGVELLYTRPGADLSHYKRIALLDCFVAFRKNWQRDQNRNSGLRVTSADMQRIRTQLAERFREVFTEELQKNGGYELVNEPGEDVLIVRPAIIDLDANAPDTQTAGRSYSFATSAGSMTLFIEVLDGMSGEIQARAVDREHGRENVRMQWQTSVQNSAEAERIIRKWAVLAREALDRARAANVTGAAATP